MKMHQILMNCAITLSLLSGSALAADDKASKQTEIRAVTQASLEKFYASVRLDIRRTTRAEFDASYVLGQESSADSEVPDTAIGNRTHHALAANAALIHDFGGLEGRAIDHRTGLKVRRQLANVHHGILDPIRITESPLERQPPHQRELTALKVELATATSAGVLSLGAIACCLTLPGGDATALTLTNENEGVS